MTDIAYIAYRVDEYRREGIPIGASREREGALGAAIQRILSVGDIHCSIDVQRKHLTDDELDLLSDLFRQWDEKYGVAT